MTKMSQFNLGRSAAAAFFMAIAAAALAGTEHEIYIIEDSGFFNAPGITAGVVGKLSTSDPAAVTILGEAGGHLGPFNWGGIGFRPGDSSQLFGFENTTNSIRRINPETDSNELIDSVGFIESGSFVSAFAVSNDGTVGYAAGTVSLWGRIVRADLATGELLSVNSIPNQHSISSIAIVPEGTDLPFAPGTLFALRNISGGVQLVILDLENNSATVQGTVSGLGFTAMFESGLDFAPDGTLYAAINGIIGALDVPTRLYTLNPVNAAATLVGEIGNGVWDVAGIAVAPPKAPTIPGDLNGDGSVGVPDLLILLANWGPCPDPQDCPADLNHDGSVGVADLLLLLSNWG